MDKGRLAEAGAVIDERLAAVPGDVQARFLKGMIAMAQGQHQQAIRLFRSILIDQPSAARVRLELARAFFLAKDYGNAHRQFQFALAGDPPAAVEGNIRRYMAAIRESKTFSYSASLSVAPDTNLNAGSSAREVTLFGLPFDLDEDARKRSGVGLAMQGGAEWAPRLSPLTNVRLGAYAERREYKGSDFDDMTIAAYAGPRIIVGKFDVSLLGTAHRRWYGSRPYSQSLGPRLEATYHATPRLDVATSLAGHRIRFRDQPYRDSRLISANVTAFYALTPTSAATFKIGFSREDAKLDVYSSRSSFIAAGYFRELPMGFSAYVEPSLSRARYEEAFAAFGEKRSDKLTSVSVTLLNRHIVLDRFTPRVSYTWTRQNSSIPLHDFDRRRVEIGLTTSF